MSDLTEKKCVPCEGGGAISLSKQEANELLKKLNDWQLNFDAPELTKSFTFKNFYKTMGFVNAIAFIANNEGHHPDLCIGYNYCTISIKTHALSGLSENDFILAAKIDELVRI